VLFKFVSQPFVALLSQFPKPGSQVPSAQLLATQFADALAKLHCVLHPPQLSGSVCRFFSQPLAALASQLPKPGLHAMLQLPVVQLGVPLVALQARPHPPQFSALVFVLVSQPLPYWPSQFANGALQLRIAQVVPLQVG
jgi:hypothetical protein